jgi:hypothetical protein
VFHPIPITADEEAAAAAAAEAEAGAKAAATEARKNTTIEVVDAEAPEGAVGSQQRADADAPNGLLRTGSYEKISLTTDAANEGAPDT